jgi:hypothetical protein
MTTRTTFSTVLSTFLALALALAAAPGCTSSNGGADVPVIEAGGQPDIQYSDAQAPTGDAADAATRPDASGPDGTADAATPGADGGASDAGTWADGCFVGRPVQMVEFLNRCTTAQTAAHTMSAPLLLADGGVPPLP